MIWLPAAGGVNVKVVPPNTRPPPVLSRTKPAVAALADDAPRAARAVEELDADAGPLRGVGAIGDRDAHAHAPGGARRIARVDRRPRGRAELGRRARGDGDEGRERRKRGEERRAPGAARGLTRARPSPYRAGRRGEPDGVRPDRVVVPVRRQAAGAADDLAVAAPLECDEAAQQERRLPGRRAARA